MISNRGKKLKIICSLVIVLAIAVMPLAGISDSPAQAAEPPQFQVSPLNPDFLDFWENPPETFYGYIPPPVDLSYLKEIPVEKARGFATLPGSFDWRDTGKVTPVKNQNPCGTCWVYGTLAAVESKVLIDENVPYDPSQHDFSEQNLVCCTDPSWVYLLNPPDYRCTGGGWSWLAADTLTKKGTRLEACQPYNTVTIDTEACDDSCTSIKRITGYHLVADSADMTNEVKNAIYNEGPVSMSYRMDEAAHMYPGNVYYWPDCPWQTNHLVSIVGWDDTIAHPWGGGYGAWIVKNSWGTEWPDGDNGYFYLCYGSANMDDVVSYRYEDYDPNEVLYYWDEAPILGSGSGAEGDDSLWGANVFTSEQNGSLSKVEFWTTSNNAQYEIYVYLDGDISDGLQNLATSQTGTCQEMGYYSIPLSPPVSLASGQSFTIAVKMTTPGYNYPMPVETVINGLCEPPIQIGVSFLSVDGNVWLDAGQQEGWNVCLRAKITSAGAPNNPPNIPSNPLPPNHAPNVSIPANLSWSGGDPDASDTVTYGAYFGTSSPPPFKETIGPHPATQSSMTYDPGILSYNTKYYWKIVATDNHDLSTEGPLWDFTTGPGELHVGPGQPYATIQAAIDDANDGDTIIVHPGTYDGFTVENRNDLSIIGQDGVTVNSANMFTNGGEWWVMAYVKSSTNINIEDIVFDGGEIEVNMLEGVTWGDSTGSITGGAVRNIIGSEMAMGVCIWGGEEGTTAVDISQLTVENCFAGVMVGNAETNLDRCSIAGMTPYGGHGIRAIDNAQVTMENCEIRDCWKEAPEPGQAGFGVVIGMREEYEADYGIEDERPSTVQMTGCTISHNNFAIYVDDDGDLIANYNNIQGNDSGGIYKLNPPSVDATNNWWGHASGPYNETTNPDGQGDAVSDNVDYFPWLKAEITPVATGLDSIKENLVIAYGYKFGEGVGGWTVYNPEWATTHPEWNTLTTLYVGRGYWINVSGVCDLTYGANTYHLDEGWNLVGWCGATAVGPPSAEDNPDVAIGLDFIEDQLVIAYGYKAGEGVGGWTVYNPEWAVTHPDWNSLTTLYMQRGYWINVSGVCDLTYGANTYHLDEGWNLIGWVGW